MGNLEVLGIENENVPGINGRSGVFIQRKPGALPRRFVVKSKIPFPIEIVATTQFVGRRKLLGLRDDFLRLGLFGRRGFGRRRWPPGYGERAWFLSQRKGTDRGQETGDPGASDTFGKERIHHKLGREEGLSLREACPLFFPSISGIPRIWPDGEVNFGL